jgi:hypothetical protein
MSYELLHVEMGKRERKERAEGLLYPLTQKRAITTIRPGISGRTPETPAFKGQHPRS